MSREIKMSTARFEQAFLRSGGHQSQQNLTGQTRLHGIYLARPTHRVVS